MKYKIALIGEAWGADEAQYRMPFVGASGQELTRMLSDAGIRRDECFISNVFNFQPDRNDISSLCWTAAQRGKLDKRPALAAGKYLKPEYFGEVERLLGELSTVRPNITVALGNTASWAILGATAISKIRGTVSYSYAIEGLKVLPTYHPAAVLRQYDLRHVTVLDLAKARRESEFPEIRKPIRRIWTEPTLGDLEDFYEKYIKDCEELAFDIETSGDQITCLGFAPKIDIAIVIPFWDLRKLRGSYWETLSEELMAWRFVEKVLAHPSAKVAQNGLYDIQFLWMKYGIPVTNFVEDTMLLHHSLQPESPKALGFLGSVYTNESSWKDMRNRAKHTIKADE